MKLGGIEYSAGFGGIELVNVPATSLPQELATAFATVNGGLLGSTWMPLWYLGTQVVNGMNHVLLVREVRTTKDQYQTIVVMKINIPNGDDGSHATIVDITEEANLSDDLKLIFSNATRGICGATYKPLAYVGHQLVHGTNHYFICESKRAVLNAIPYLTMVCINVLDGKEMLVSIEPVVEDESNGKCVNAPLGEWP